MAKTETPKPSFAPMGSGIEFAISGNTLLVKVDLDAKKGFASGSGKMVLVGSTGGWQTIPGSDGWRTNIMVGRKVAPGK